MSKHYGLLKGTVSQLTVFEDPKEIRADNIGLFAFIGLTLMGLIGSAAALIGSLTAGSVKLEGQGFFCYVGSERVEGKLVRVGFHDGDYVELIVKRQKTGVYKVYAARVPNQHAFYFPRSVGTPTLELLKNCSIITGALSLFAYIGLSVISIIVGNILEDFIILFIVSCGSFVF